MRDIIGSGTLSPQNQDSELNSLNMISNFKLQKTRLLPVSSHDILGLKLNKNLRREKLNLIARKRSQCILLEIWRLIIIKKEKVGMERCLSYRKAKFPGPDDHKSHTGNALSFHNVCWLVFINVCEGLKMCRVNCFFKFTETLGSINQGS